MNLQNKITTNVNLVLNCSFCQPLSGCVLSNLKGKKKNEIKTYLHGLSEKNLDRIISYHECCPYRERLAM